MSWRAIAAGAIRIPISSSTQPHQINTPASVTLVRNRRDVRIDAEHDLACLYTRWRLSNDTARPQPHPTRPRRLSDREFRDSRALQQTVLSKSDWPSPATRANARSRSLASDEPQTRDTDGSKPETPQPRRSVLRVAIRWLRH